MKSAIVTGVTGQDGSYLSELLLSEGYFVYGGLRRNSDFTTDRINHIFDHPNFKAFNFDSVDPNSAIQTIIKSKPNLFFNLAAMSHVGTSFDLPNYAGLADGLGVVGLIEILRLYAPDCVFYQASTSELFGGELGQSPQDLDTRFDPRSPYAVAKQMAYYATLNARRRGDLMTVNGILFNHESPRRGKTFVTKKITRHVGSLKRQGNQNILELGNLSAVRDWGYAPDYVQIMYDSVINPTDDVYCCGTGIGKTVRQFCSLAFNAIGIELIFHGEGLDEKGYNSKTGEVLITVNEKYYRPLEVECLIAGLKGNKLMNTKHFNLDELVSEMVDYDIKNDKYGANENEVRHSRFWK
ncbi:GDP-mannose 4,6-dehydratase [Amylibacter sp.]|nr:GDP-mannose 4,6-dehydratase [Amylibacter sp.]MDC3304285.1 GDP-mannose 4,6-dehydratase [Amylibacter sp.]